MKPNLLLSLLLVCSLFIYSCKTREHATIGMTETEFTKRNSKAERVEASANTATYKIDLVVLASYRRNIKYYYFENGKLAKIDQGERRPDILIENTIKP